MGFWDRIHAPRRADWGGSTMSDSTANDPFYARPAPRRVPAPAAPPVDEDGGLRGAMGQALGGYEGETIPGRASADREYWDRVYGRGVAYYGGGQSADPSWVNNPIHPYEGGTNFVGPTMDELLGVGARPLDVSRPARAPGRRPRRAGTGTDATPPSNRGMTPPVSETVAPVGGPTTDADRGGGAPVGSTLPLNETYADSTGMGGPGSSDWADTTGMGRNDPRQQPPVGPPGSTMVRVPRGTRGAQYNPADGTYVLFYY